MEQSTQFIVRPNDMLLNARITNNKKIALRELAKAKEQESQYEYKQVYDPISRCTKFVKII